MQAQYQIKPKTPHWDALNLEYPVRKFPPTEPSSETIARKWRTEPEVLKNRKEPLEEIKQYHQDYQTQKELSESVTSLDYSYKHPITKRHNKHTSCMDNHYIYPPSRKQESRPPPCHAFGTTEMQSAYQEPVTPARLVTGKDQLKYNLSFPEPPLEPAWKDLGPTMDTSQEGFIKYLDPYVTTSRLHHRPYTAEQLSRLSACKDIVTFHTWSEEPWVRSQKPKAAEKPEILITRPKPVYDKEKFKHECREVRTHKTLKWTPGSFRTEVRDNYDRKSLTQEYHENRDFHRTVRSDYKRDIANLPVNDYNEDGIVKRSYKTIYAQGAAGKPLYALIDQHPAKNKRLQMLEDKLK